MGHNEIIRLTLLTMAATAAVAFLEKGEAREMVLEQISCLKDASDEEGKREDQGLAP